MNLLKMQTNFRDRCSMELRWATNHSICHIWNTMTNKSKQQQSKIQLHFYLQKCTCHFSIAFAGGEIKNKQIFKSLCSRPLYFFSFEKNKKINLEIMTPWVMLLGEKGKLNSAHTHTCIYSEWEKQKHKIIKNIK